MAEKISGRPFSIDRIPALFPPFILACLGTLGCIWLWRRTGEILVDFGNELYVAWQLSQGRVLYRDVAYVYGPLSPYFNALLMRVFGPRLEVILLANAAVLAIVVALLYRLLRAIGGTLPALVATFFFLVYFAFSCAARITNYNFLTPYSHAMTQGFALCLGIVLCMDSFARSGSMRSVGIGGFLTGLAFLTKPEIFLAAAATYGLGLAAAMWVRRSRRAWRIVLIALCAAIAPPLIALVLLSLAMSVAQAFTGVRGGWQFVRAPFVVAAPFYTEILGTDHPAHNLLEMLYFAGLYAMILIALIAAGWLGGNLRAKPLAFTLLALAITAGGYGVVHFAGDNSPTFWANADRGLPIFAALAVIWTGCNILHRRGNSASNSRALLQWSLAVLSLFLLAKMFLNARTYQYGFVLAAPCVMLAVIALIKWLPAAVARRGGSGFIVRCGGVGLLAALAINRLTLTQRVLEERTLPIPLALGGTINIRPIDASAAVAIQRLRGITGTVAILPDAAGIDFAASRSNSVPYNTLNAMTFAMYGEPTVLAAFDAHPSDFILIMQIDLRAFGGAYFGQDYGRQLMEWITKNYRPVASFNNGPRNPLQLWQRN